MDFRPAEITDLEDIFQMETETFEKDAWSKDYISEYVQRSNTKEDKNVVLYFLLRKSDKLVSVISCECTSSSDFYVSNLMVGKEYQRCGYGTFLLQKMIEEARNRNFSFCTLHVETTNKAALSLYLKLGFVVSEHVKDYYGENRGAYLMKLSLDSSHL